MGGSGAPSAAGPTKWEITIAIVPIVISVIALLISWLAYNIQQKQATVGLQAGFVTGTMVRGISKKTVDCIFDVHLYNSGGIPANMDNWEAFVSYPGVANSSLLLTSPKHDDYASGVSTDTLGLSNFDATLYTYTAGTPSADSLKPDALLPMPYPIAAYGEPIVRIDLGFDASGYYEFSNQPTFIDATPSSSNPFGTYRSGYPIRAAFHFMTRDGSHAVIPDTICGYSVARLPIYLVPTPIINFNPRLIPTRVPTPTPPK